MKYLSRIAKADDAETAVKQLREKFAGFPVKTLVFFASSKYDGPRVASLIRDAFPGALTLGCSSYAELGEGATHSGVISAMAFSPDSLACVEAVVAENISGDPMAVDKAFALLETKLGAKMMDLDFHRHFGVILFDGTSPNIEKVMERIGNLSDIIFVGGYASDDFSMTRIQQYLDGKAYRDAAVLAVFKPTGTFALLKTQSAESLGKSFIATRVDEASRTILELDGVPAAEAYARGIGIPKDKLTDEHFLLYPLGLMASGEPFIRAGRRILDNGGLQLFCSVKEGQRLVLMKTGDIVASTARALEAKREQLGKIGGILDFDCAHRAMTLETDPVAVDNYGKLFKDTEAAGFATFGEAYIANVNQTSVMVLFT